MKQPPCRDPRRIVNSVPPVEQNQFASSSAPAPDALSATSANAKTPLHLTHLALAFSGRLCCNRNADYSVLHFPSKGPQPMTPERQQKLEELCSLALAREPQARSSFLAEACQQDEELRREVESLISRTVTASILGSPIGVGPTVAVAPGIPAGPKLSWMPASVGRYRILRIIGEGGMGVVYEAEQDQPRRIVALKIIRPGFASAKTLRRFARESEALARLHHVGIAQIYEAGTAETGFEPQPYFAMEFIRGTRLREYVDSHGLTTGQRLEVMARVCEAVEHAHENGIIHRDLKPGNILVDETGQPKILDFGVARLADSDAQMTKQTEVGQLVGTLAYMSPEQVLADPGQLDRRSDVYALGVILYELLAQRLPYDLSDKVYEAVRTIREEDPKRLSAINRTFRGDVETIVAKALEKDKARRYGSASAMLGDIRKHLADQPITARPATTTYQLQKFVRRHRTLVTATALVFAVLVAGVVVSTAEAIKARKAEQTAQAVNDFLQNDLLAQASASNQANPDTKPDPDLKVRTALDRAAIRITGKFQQQPEVEAAIRDTIGQTYWDLGLYPEAKAQMQRALELYRRAYGDSDRATLKALARVGSIASLQGNYAEAETLLTQALEVQRRRLGPEHADTLGCMSNLANVYYGRAKYVEAAALLNQVLELQRRTLGPEHPDTLISMNNLASVYQSQAKYPDAEALYRTVLDARRRLLGPEHPLTVSTISNLAFTYEKETKDEESEALLSQAVEIQRRVLGPNHPDTVRSMNQLAGAYLNQRKFAQAEAFERQALEVQRQALGPEHLETLASAANLAYVYGAEGKYADAEKLQGSTLQIMRRVLGPEHPYTLTTVSVLANVYAAEGKYAQAEALQSETLESMRRTLGPDNDMTLACLADSAAIYQQEHKYSQAEALAAEALAGRRRVLGPDHNDTIASMADVALIYVSQKKFAEAEPLAREAVDTEKKQRPDDWLLFRAESLLGASLAGQKKFAEAEPLLTEGYQGMLAQKERIAAPDRYHLNLARQWLLQFYRASGQPEKAAALKK